MYVTPQNPLGVGQLRGVQSRGPIPPCPRLPVPRPCIPRSRSVPEGGGNMLASEENATLRKSKYTKYFVSLDVPIFRYPMLVVSLECLNIKGLLQLIAWFED